MKIAVYPGSFDPVTLGHLDVIKRAATIFDKLIVGVLVNSAKTSAFSPNERVDMLRRVAGELENVEIRHFNGLLVDFCRENGASVIVKGLRAVSDFEYEFQMALTNRKIANDVDTVFLTTTPEYMYLSSSIVREVARYGGDISDFVSSEIEDEIKSKLFPRGEKAGEM